MSLTALIRERVTDLLDDNCSVRVPQRGQKAGMEVTRPDGTIVVYRLVPGEAWEGELQDENGITVGYLHRVPRTLPSDEMAAALAKAINEADEDTATY